MAVNNVENQVGCILCEETATSVEFKIKGEDKLGFVTAEGVVQQGNEVNRNRRFYPTEELARNLMSPRTKELVESGNFKGEAGHPTDTSLARQAKVDPRYEQVWYKKFWMDGDYVKAWFTGTSNDLGKSFNDDLKRGQKPSFSLRAVGALTNENGRMTVRNMQMIAYDRVYFPSHSKAYTSHIITTESTLGYVKENIQYTLADDDYFAAKIEEINALTEAGNILDGSGTIETPLTQSEMNGYILAESKNIQDVINSFDILYESMTLDPSMKLVTMKTKIGDTIYLSLEEAVQKEITFGIANMFK